MKTDPDRSLVPWKVFPLKAEKHDVLSFISHFISSTKNVKKQFEIHNVFFKF